MTVHQLLGRTCVQVRLHRLASQIKWFKADTMPASPATHPNLSPTAAMQKRHTDTSNPALRHCWQAAHLASKYLEPRGMQTISLNIDY
jgi:hypothetical protein